VNPKLVVKVVWTSSWFDPGKERAAADTLIAGGADIVTHHTDSTAVTQAGEEKGVFTIGYNSDMARFGPKTSLTAVTHQWGDYYIERVKAAIAGSWASGDTWGGFKAGMTKLAPYNSAIPAAVRQQTDAAIAGIAGGTLKPFQGPLVDQDGKSKLAAGQSLADADILMMNWFVQGVQGKV
jgi:simple sugar transport system substrate-binding protein